MKPFRTEVAQAELDGLQGRIAATRRPTEPAKAEINPRASRKSPHGPNGRAGGHFAALEKPDLSVRKRRRRHSADD